jgi:hypothetical protein
MRMLVCAALGIALVLGVGAAARADRLQDRVSAANAYAEARGTTTAIAFLDRLTGQYRDNGAVAHRRIESASVMKVFIAEHLLHRQDRGQLRLSGTDWYDLGRMLRDSANAPANRFWSTYGANGIVSDVINRYGLTETGLTSNVRYWGNTLITAHDMIVFYRRLLDGSGGLSAASRDYIIDQMRQSSPQGDGGYQFFGLRDGLPHEPVIAQKQGWMCCVNGDIYRHSTGLVGPDNRFVVVVLAREISSRGAAHIEGSVTGAVRAMFPEGRIPRVQNAIGEAWYRSGGAGGPLGMPIGDEGGLPDRRGIAQWFQGGPIYWSGSTGAHAVVNGNLQAWARKGYENGPLGYPATDEGGLPDGRGIAQWFQGGAIYWSALTGSHSVVNGNLKAWATQNYENGRLGYPTTDETGLPDGRGIVQWFQGGGVYWSAASGSRPVIGDNLGAWSSVGYENGSLGYPVSSEATLPDGQGTAQWFQGGAIYRSPDTGAHALPRPLLQAWIDRGAENGALGYPVSDPYAVSGGTRIDFQRGTLTSSSATGTVS